ncbi:hypothetical protein [Streptomyces sp. ALI-76-A]|jgi:hypothetical protein|uniref:hypothetical protein n=1 Tax=Streptomyces sp. ALI-76-A TaxID=3025736 RepID=UPI00256F02B5|nr:hypothetical protein [Streptomyces sp. ALI-76-A]MDL5204132.1 hypothetical protein [Streptomyces sp. ALI-76-A]
MTWEEWEQLKAQAAERQSTHMQLNQLDGGGGTSGSPVAPREYGVLKVGQGDLSKIGKTAHTLYNELWDKARVAVPSSDSAAGDLSKQGFALGAGLRHVSTRWEEQLKSLMDAIAHISNHMHVTKKVHGGDDDFIRRQMSSIDALDAGFDERVGNPGEKNPVYDQAESKKKE